MGLEEYYDLRERLVDEVLRDFTGPSAQQDARPDESILSEDPITRYQAAVLYPITGDTIRPVDDIDAGNDGSAALEDEAEDQPVALASVRYPSSMGVSFAVGPDITALVIHITAISYRAIEGGDSAASTGARGARRRWERLPFVAEPVTLDIGGRAIGRKPVTDGLDLFWRIRPPDAQAARAVTVGLINSNRLPAGEFGRDAYAWFNPTLTVRSRDDVGAFVARPQTRVAGVDDADLATYRLLYRHTLEFATGHGCSVDWTLGEDHATAVEIRSTYTPQYELRLADSNPAIRSPWFTLKSLGSAPRADALSGLHAFVGEYEQWIADRHRESGSLEPPLREIAEGHLRRCQESARRMHAGIEILSRDTEAWEAFVLMNQAMLAQRARTDWFKSLDHTAAPQMSEKHAWRPFQLAFILQALAGIAEPSIENPVDPSVKDRDLVDLLWFPTGGGKTEAYLGLIAFTILLRRLRNRGSGVTALMRYTLRLLTIQQFERAATLICALEVMRRANKAQFGNEEISIGLWVGGDATPLTRRQTQEALDKLRNNIPMEKGNPVQLHQCPWCGAALDHKNYWVAKQNPRLVIACKNPDCEFKDGIPAWIVDEDVYARRPSLLIGTVDKFASLPWRDDAAHIFNLRSSDPPPELIIQDELHLISGPLGTLTGLYETAVDYLCTDGDVRPKVLASTATIRRADDQVGGLFARRVRQFPSPGIDSRDNWFSVEASPEEKGSRLYVGLMTPGTSQTTLLVRAYAALLQNTANLEADDAVKDAYWTLLGYFNSLRVLGGARMQVHDDVPDRIDLLAARAGAASRKAERVIELTSRESSSVIPSHLRDMSRDHTDRSRLDVILATNMISVGVDIDRLSLMAVMGQPQSAAEYIQATSRVGRKHPGLVFVLLNAARSRDRSHYESFRAFHSALYRQVESTSVTPYSPRAVDRGLHAVVVGLARLVLPGYGGTDGAAAIRNDAKQLESVFSVILKRVEAVAHDHRDAIGRALERIRDEWSAAAAEEQLVYANRHKPLASLLIAASDTTTITEGHFRTLWSLRDVDTESNMFLVKE